MSDAVRILEISGDRSEAIAWSRGAARPISLALLTLEGHDVEVGDWVLASAGLAVERLDEREARELLSIMEAAGEEEGIKP